MVENPSICVFLIGHSFLMLLLFTIISTFIHPYDLTILAPLYHNSFMSSKLEYVKKYILRDLVLKSGSFDIDNFNVSALARFQADNQDFFSLSSFIIKSSDKKSSLHVIKENFPYSIDDILTFANYIDEIRNANYVFNITMIYPLDESFVVDSSLKFKISNPFNVTDSSRNKTIVRKLKKKCLLEYVIKLDEIELIFPDATGNNNSNRNILTIDMTNYDEPLEMSTDLLPHGLIPGPHRVTIDIYLSTISSHNKTERSNPTKTYQSHASTALYFYYFPLNAKLNLRNENGIVQLFNPLTSITTTSDIETNSNTTTSAIPNTQSQLHSLDNESKFTEKSYPENSSNDNINNIDNRTNNNNNNNNNDYFIPLSKEAVIGWKKSKTSITNIDSSRSTVNNQAIGDSSTIQRDSGSAYNNLNQNSNDSLINSKDDEELLTVEHPVIILSPINNQQTGYKHILQGAFPYIYLSYSTMKVVLVSDGQVYDITNRVRENLISLVEAVEGYLMDLVLTIDLVKNICKFEVEIEGMSIGRHSLQVHVTEIGKDSSKERRFENNQIVDENGQILDPKQDNREVVQIVASSETITFFRA